MKHKIALIGYGKVGQLIDHYAHDYNCDIIYKFTSSQEIEKALPTLQHLDACIDFSQTEAFLLNFKLLSPHVNCFIVGTTGWHDSITNVQALIAQHKIKFLFAPNFSLGMFLFQNIVKTTSSLFSHLDEYDVSGHEIHHNQKQDLPSGTARKLAHLICSAIPRKKNLKEDLNSPVLPSELQFSSSRIGYDIGTHSITFDSPTDTITLTHHAKNRDCFAQGALLATQWLLKQSQPGYYDPNLFFEEIISCNHSKV